MSATSIVTWDTVLEQACCLKECISTPYRGVRHFPQGAMYYDARWGKYEPTLSWRTCDTSLEHDSNLYRRDTFLKELRISKEEKVEPKLSWFTSDNFFSFFSEVSSLSIRRLSATNIDRRVGCGAYNFNGWVERNDFSYLFCGPTNRGEKMNRIEAHAVSSSSDKARRWFGRLVIYSPKIKRLTVLIPAQTAVFSPFSF